MKNNSRKIVLLFVLIFSCHFISNAQTKNLPPKPLQVFISAGQNVLNVDPINDLLIPNGFSSFRSSTFNIGVGIQREVFKKTIFNTEVYTGRSLNHNGSFIQSLGWHTTYGYVLINNHNNRLFPFIGFSISSASFNSTKSNNINTINNYLITPPDQLSIYSLAVLGQIGLQCDVKKNTDDNSSKLAIRVGYGIGNSKQLVQRGTSNALFNSPTINPAGFYVKIFYFLK